MIEYLNKYIVWMANKYFNMSSLSKIKDKL